MPYLLAAAISTAIAALLHLGCIVFGGDWYRFFGAGEQMARLSEQGSAYPAQITSVIVLLLSVWSLYALSGAGVILRLPLLRTALCAITAVFIVRGLGFVFLMPMFPENSITFWLTSSAVCLSIGSLYGVGLVKVWPALSSRS